VSLVVSIHQPPYFPWLGLIDKIARSDVFVVLDSVQYIRAGFLHRTLYSAPGGARYLSLPVRAKGHQQAGLQIGEAQLAEPLMPQTHLKTLRQRYGKRPGWRRLEGALEAILGEPVENLLELNLRTLALTLSLFGLEPAILLASALEGAGRKGDLMLSLTQAAKGDTYLSGSGAKSYMDDQLFARQGVGVLYQHFEHPVYPQSHGGEFQPGCLAVEWFLEDPEGAREGFYRHLERTGDSPPRCWKGFAA
jgi:hypothetical protein